MASRAAARSFLRSSSSVRSSFLRSSPPRSVPSSVLPKPARSFLWSPVKMSSFCVESLMPMHSATASAVMNSLLVASRRNCGWLSEAGKDDV